MNIAGSAVQLNRSVSAMPPPPSRIFQTPAHPGTADTLLLTWPTRHLKTLFVLVLLGALVGCTKQQTAQIADTTKPSTLTLAPAHGAAGRGLSLSIRGRIDGVARIWYGGASTNEVSGRIDMSYDDNCSTNFLVHYVPEGVRTGQVTIKYAFH